MTGKGKKKADPTIRDISDKLDFVMGIVEKRFAAADKRFDAMDKRFDSVDKKFVVMNNRIDNVDERLGLLGNKVQKIEVTVLDMQEEIRGALDAIDKDSELVLNHERRIRRLEKVR